MTPAQYKKLVEKQKSEDDICIQEIVPYLTKLKNSKKIPFFKFAKIVNENTVRSVALHIKQWKMGKQPGIPDYLLTWGPSYGWIEVKKVGGVLSKEQKLFQKDCKESNVPHAVVHNWEELDIALKDWGLLK